MVDREEARDFIRFVSTVLNSLRRTVDAPFEAVMRQNETEGARLFRSIIMDLESAKLMILPLRNTKELPIDVIGPLSSLSRELTRILENAEYARALRAIKYRRFPDGPIARAGAARAGIQRPLSRFPDLDAPNALAAIDQLIDRVTDFAAPSGGDAAQRELFKLRSIIPAQKIAPEVEFVCYV